MGHDHDYHRAADDAERPLYGVIALTGTIFFV